MNTKAVTPTVLSCITHSHSYNVQYSLPLYPNSNTIMLFNNTRREAGYNNNNNNVLSAPPGGSNKALNKRNTHNAIQQENVTCNLTKANT